MIQPLVAGVLEEFGINRLVALPLKDAISQAFCEFTGLIAFLDDGIDQCEFFE